MGWQLDLVRKTTIAADDDGRRQQPDADDGDTDGGGQQHAAAAGEERRRSGARRAGARPHRTAQRSSAGLDWHPRAARVTARRQRIAARIPWRRVRDAGAVGRQRRRPQPAAEQGARTVQASQSGTGRLPAARAVSSRRRSCRFTSARSPKDQRPKTKDQSERLKTHVARPTQRLPAVSLRDAGAGIRHREGAVGVRADLDPMRGRFVEISRDASLVLCAPGFSDRWSCQVSMPAVCSAASVTAAPPCARRC